MRRSIVETLRCPRCRRGALQSRTDATDIVFGPLDCGACGSSFPVSEGVAEVMAERESPAMLQRGMELPWVARSWERYLRSAVSLAIQRRRVDRESEYLLYRALMGQPDGPILDLGCGTGLFARRLAHEQGLPPVIGLDVSRPMVDEAMAQAREANVKVDYLRAEAPHLPFLDASLGAVVQADALHWIEDADVLFAEVFRVLRPGGRYVGRTYVPPGFPASFVHQKAGLHPRSEEELKSSLARAGMVHFERMLVAPFILIKAEKSA